ncbi:MAG: glycosyltransferase family 2 protein [bacterium]
MLETPNPSGQTLAPLTEQVTVIIVTYRSAEYIGACLDSVQKQTLPPSEIIVVDNSSGDGTPDLVRRRFPNVNILELNTNQGYGGGVNAGCSIAATDFIAVFNPDVSLAPDVIEKMVATMQAGGPKIGAVTARIINHGVPQEVKGGTLNLFGARVAEFFDDPSRVFYPSGAAFVFRRSVVNPPFDSDFFLYYEDVWLGCRLRCLGFEVVKAYEAQVDHFPQGSVRHTSDIRISFYQERNRLLAMLGFYSVGTLLKVAPVFCLDAAARALTAPWGGRSMAAILFAHLHFVLSPRNFLVKRWKWRAGGETKDGELLKFLSARWVPSESLWNRFLLRYCRTFDIPVAELQEPNEDGRAQS